MLFLYGNVSGNPDLLMILWKKKESDILPTIVTNITPVVFN